MDPARDSQGRFGDGDAGPRVRDPHGRFKPSIVPAFDDKGHSAVLTAQVPSEIIRIVEELITDARVRGIYPWRTRSDVIRWLLVAGLGCLDQAREEFEPNLARLQLEQSMRDMPSERLLMDKVFRTVSQEVEALLDVDFDDAQLRLQGAMKNLLKMPDTAWRNVTIDKLKSQFPQLLKRTPAAMLVRRRQAREILPKERKR